MNSCPVCGATVHPAPARMTGIISHVEELKEQIDLQIIVEKTNNGSSIKTNFGVYS